MNKQEALKKIEELKQFVEQCDKKKERILVPKEIVFEKNCGLMNNLGLVFDTNRKLYMNSEGYHVLPNRVCDNLRHGDLELVKVDPSELKVGEWYVITDSIRCTVIDYGDKECYSLYIGDNEYKFISYDRDVLTVKHSNYMGLIIYEVRRVVEE